MPVIGTGSGTVLQQGTIAARPAASASNTGYHYFASDLNGGTLFQSDGASWVQIAAAVTQTAGSSTLAGDTDVAIASPVGGQVLGYSSALSKWVNQNQAGVAATQTSAVLTADVSMPSANTYYDGPSITLAPGTWLLTGTVTVVSVSPGGDATAKLWDGTTNYASTEGFGTAGSDISLSLSAVVSPASTTTYKISVANQVAASAIKAQTAANAAGSTASFLRAIQLSGNPVGQQAPAVRCYNSVAQSIPDGVYTLLTFDTNDFDQGTSVPQHSIASNNSRLVCQQSGVYEVDGLVTLASNATGERAVKVRLNGTTDVGFGPVYSPPVTGDVTSIPFSFILRLNVGDYIEILVFQGTGGALNVNGGYANTYFSMARIDSGPGAVQPNTKVQLDWSATTDNGPSITANTWIDISSNQSFTIDDPNSIVELAVSGCALIPGACQYQVRAVIDSGGTPTNKTVSGGWTPAGGYNNIFNGSNVVTITGLSGGSHTVKLQCQSNVTETLLGNYGSNPLGYFLSIRVLERKQSVSPPSSTPAPAVRCYNSATQSIPNATDTALAFDTNRFDQGTSTPQHSTSTQTSKLICYQAGVYQITGNLNIAASAGGTYRIGLIRLNGTTHIAESSGFPSAATDCRLIVSTQWQLAVGDYVELVVYQDSGGALNTQHNLDTTSEFMMARIDTGALPAYTWQTKTSAYTMVTTDYGGILANATGGSFTVTLPTAVGAVNRYTVKKVDSSANTVTVATQSAQTIDGASTYSLSTQNSAVTVESDGTNWYVQAKV